jgi:hypothetical protein
VRGIFAPSTDSIRPLRRVGPGDAGSIRAVSSRLVDLRSIETCVPAMSVPMKSVAINSVPGLHQMPGDPFGRPEAPGGPGGPSAGTGLLEREETREQLDDGDHDRFAHYVRKNKIMQSAVNGTPVIALCGKVWVPGRDPEKYPICPTCKEIFEGLKSGGGKGPDGKGGSGSGGPGLGPGSGPTGA